MLDDGYGGHIVNAVAEDQTENFPAVRRAKNEASGEEGGRRTSALVAGHEYFPCAVGYNYCALSKLRLFD